MASFFAAFIGTVLILVFMLLGDLIRAAEIGMLLEVGPSLIRESVETAVFALPVGTFIGTFVIAAYLLVFGVPVALLLHGRLNSFVGISVSLASALIASYAALAMIFGNLDKPFIFYWQPLCVVFAYALPAGFLFHRSATLLLKE